jgi:hypothetical protein
MKAIVTKVRLESSARGEARFTLESSRDRGHAATHRRRASMMRARELAGWAAISSLLFGATPLRAEVLITESEAKLPNDETLARGAMTGPKVLLVSPPRDAHGVKAPFDLEIRFEGRNGVKVDLNSLVVTYKKTPPVDLTERVKDFLTSEGIAMPKAEVPPGDHKIHVEIRDVDGRIGGAEFSIDAAP